jgi:hypothetical protein
MAEETAERINLDSVKMTSRSKSVTSLQSPKVLSIYKIRPEHCVPRQADVYCLPEQSQSNNSGPEGSPQISYLIDLRTLTND